MIWTDDLDKMGWQGRFSKLKWQDSDWKTVWLDRLKNSASFVLHVLSPVFKGTRKENQVAYLDGLRGFAAFIVYCVHHTAYTHENEKRLHHAFGFRDEYIFAAFPIVQLFFAGGAFAVAIFFAISGYALSASPIRLLFKPREEGGLRLATQLGASFPRRWLRLYLPVIITTFVFMTSWHLFGVESSLAKHPESNTTYFEDLTKWMNEFAEGSYVFVTTAGFGQSEYNPHMWSIAVEYRGSAIVYISFLSYFALGYGPNARFWASLGLLLYFQLIADGPYYALFVVGMLLCDIDAVAELDPDLLPRVLQSKGFKILRRHTWIYYILLLVGLYLGSAPQIAALENLHAEPGWSMLAYLTPSTSSNVRWYFCMYSAALCVISIPRISWLRRMFESSLFQYLGKVSFGFYLVHGPIMWIVGDRLYAAVGRPRHTADTRIPGWINILPIPDKGPVGLELNAVVPHLILLPLTLWLAGVTTKLVDVPSVKLSKWVFKTPSPKLEAPQVQVEMEGLLPYHTEQPL